MEEIFYKFKEGIISKFEDKLREQNLKIQELESKIHSQENTFKKLETISDDNEQHIHRSWLRFHGIEFKESDSSDVMEELKNVIMSRVFRLMRMKLTERMASESPSWIMKGKRKLGQ